MRLLEVEETLTPADHQTQRVYAFDVPAGCVGLSLRVRYAPKHLSPEDSAVLVRNAISSQATHLPEGPLREAWRESFTRSRAERRVANLLTISLDDATGAYRGAGHRQAADQTLTLGSMAASPGLVAGPLPPGPWRLTLSVHTLVSNQCIVSIQIGAETAVSTPSASRSSA